MVVKTLVVKGWTIRKKGGGEGGGTFSDCRKFFTSTASAGFFVGVKSPAGTFFERCNFVLTQSQSWQSPQSVFLEQALDKLLLCFTQSVRCTVKIILRGKHNEAADAFKCYCLKWPCIAFSVRC